MAHAKEYKKNGSKPIKGANFADETFNKLRKPICELTFLRQIWLQQTDVTKKSRMSTNGTLLPSPNNYSGPCLSYVL